MLSFLDRSSNQKTSSQPALDIGDEATEGTANGIEFSIPRDTCIRGSIETKCKLRLEGDAYGPITASEVTVEIDATVEGEINAKEIVVKGRIKGPLRAKHVYLYASGEVDGDMVISSMVIEEGARFLGTIQQEKYSVAKPVIKRVTSLEEDYSHIPTDNDANIGAKFLEVADRMRGASLREIADNIMK